MKSLLSGVFGLLGFAYACDPQLCPASSVTSMQKGNGVCDLACLSLSCEWDGNDCLPQCLALGCDSADLASGTCEEACNSPVCGFDHWDCATEEAPAQLFVSATQNGANLGTRADPLWSLSSALELMELPWVTINLFEGTHSLTPGVSSNMLPYPFSRVIIQTYFCTGESDPLECAQHFAVVKLAFHLASFTIASSLTLINLILDGALSVRSGCDTCLYCPYTTLVNEVLYDDRGEIVDEDTVASQSWCSSYNSLYFISVSGTLLSQNVTFRHFRQQYAALIYSTSGSVTLINTNFYQVQAEMSEVTSAVISQNQCSDLPYGCGSLTYRGGEVTLLNNGYEYRSDLALSGFIYGVGFHAVTIEGVKFSYNWVAGATNLPSLIHFRNVRTLLVSECEFVYNIAIGGLIRVLADFVIPVVYSDGILQDHNLTHIQVVSCVFANNTGTQANLVLTYTQDLQNIEIRNCSFTEIMGAVDSVLTMNSPTLTTELQFGVSRSITVDGATVTAYFPPRIFNISGLYISLSDAGTGFVVNFVNHPNVYISKSTFLNNGLISAPKSIKDFVYSAFMSHPDIYASLIPPLTQTFGRLGVIYGIGGFYSFTFITAINNTSSRGAMALGGVVSSAAHDLYLEGNVGTTSLGSGLSFSGTLNVLELYNIVGKGNSCQNGRGAVAVFTKGTAPNVTVRDCVFEGNFAQRSAAMLIADAAQVTMRNVTFVRNWAVQSGGALTIRVSASATSATFTLSDCIFLGNSVSLTGVLFFESVATKVATTLIQTLRLNFTSNTADQGSALYIGIDFYLNVLSTIEDCTFLNNTSARDGIVYLAYSGGSLLLDNGYFEGNRANQGSGVYAGYASAPAFLSLSHSRFLRNSGANGAVTVPESLRRPWLQTSQNTFLDNACQGIVVTSGQWTDTGSVFTNNTGTVGGAVQLVAGATAELTGTVLTANSALQYGGAFSVSESSSLNCTDCTASWNRCGMKGAVVYAFNNSTMNLRNCLLSNNTSAGQASAIYLSASSRSSHLVNSTVADNSAKSFGFLVLNEASFAISASLIQANEALELTAGVHVLMSNFTLEDSTARKQHGYYGGLLYASQFANIIITNCRLEEIQAGKQGGVVSASQTVTIRIQNTVFSAISSPMGGLFKLDKDSLLSLDSCVVQNCQSSDWLISMDTGQLEIQKSTFLNTSGAVIYGKDLSFLSLQDSSIELVRAESSAVWCADCKEVILSHSEISDCEGGAQGGGLRVSSSAGIFTVSTVTGVKFARNRAVEGGGMSVEVGSLTVSSSAFVNNTAEKQGGGMSLNCVSQCSFLLKETEYRGNAAGRNGGGMVWTGSKPTVSDLSFASNSAIYGKDIASFPVGLQLISTPDLILTSGQIKVEPFGVAVVDHYGQTVFTDNSSVVGMLSRESMSIQGTLRYEVTEGTAQVAGYQVTAQPGSWVSLQLTPENWGTGVSLNISAYMRFCEAGEYQNGLVCESCSFGYFSLRPDMQCTRCPPSAECLGNFTLVPKAGYWRASNLTTTILPCPNKNACLGSPDLSNVSLTGGCAEGYYGNLCNGCVLSRFRSETNVCSPCPSRITNNVILSFLCLALLIVAVLLIFTSIRSATRPKSLLSIYIKIFMNYIQLVIACSSVNLNYPSQLLEFSRAQGQIGNVDNQVFSIDCYFDNPDSIESIQRKLLIIALALLIVAVLATVAWVILKIIRRKTSFVFSKGIATVIILFFLLHPAITRNSFAQFDCMLIEPEEKWLVANLNVRCWQGLHSTVALTLALPCVLLWVFSLPAVTLFYLTTHRSKLDLVESKLKFGFLVNGYERNAYYWEFVILYRKVMVVCFSVFLSTEGTEIQALCLMIVLIVAFLLQRKVQPYTTPQLNSLESRGILVSGVTIYCGMYFISSNISDSAVLALFAIIIVANAYFLLYWVFLMSGTTLLLVLNRCPVLRAVVSRSRALSSLLGLLQAGHNLPIRVVPHTPFVNVTKEEDHSANRELSLKAPHSSIDFSGDESNFSVGK